MPASPQLWTLGKSEWSSLQSWVRGGRPKAPRPFGVSRLKFLGRPPRSGVEAPLVGGNLSVWTSLVGTRHAMSASGKILFIEEIDEAVYRMDRLIRQVEASGGLKNVRAVVLGDFQNCGDAVRRALKKKPKLSELSRVLKTKPSNFYAPIRPLMTEKKSLQEVFGFLSEELGIPVAYGLPVGHGPGWALPIGARYALKPTGELSLLSWKWLRER